MTCKPQGKLRIFDVLTGRGWVRSTDVLGAQRNDDRRRQAERPQYKRHSYHHMEAMEPRIRALPRQASCSESGKRKKPVFAARYEIAAYTSTTPQAAHGSQTTYEARGAQRSLAVSAALPFFTLYCHKSSTE